MKWTYLHPRAQDFLGFLPDFVSDMNERPARDQFDQNYMHGGGWSPMDGWTMEGDNIKYPVDPAYRPIAKAQLRDETILVYQHAWVCIRQADGTFEVARMD